MPTKRPTQTTTAGQSELALIAREKLDSSRTRIVARLAKIAAVPLKDGTVQLVFATRWNAYHSFDLHCYQQDSAGESITASRPFGSLFSFDAPPGQEHLPNAFSEEKPVVAELVLMQFAAWWREAGGDPYRVPVVGTYKNKPTLAFDFAAREWMTDPYAVDRLKRTEEYAELFRVRLTSFRPHVLNRLQAAVAKLKSGGWEFEVEVHFDDEFSVTYRVSDGKKHAQGGLFPPSSQLAKLLKNDAFYTERDRFAALGADVGQTRRRELERFVADVWGEVAGPERTVRARLQYHDGEAEYDLIARRWLTDFLGRPLLASEEHP